ncbi:MAG: hypothetical protein ACREB9_01230, partial [Thermoplasmata archaeon]
VLKRSVRWAKSGYTWAPYIVPTHAGQLDAQANLAQAAYEAAEQGLINTDGLPGAAGHVRDTLSGKQTNPDYYRRLAEARAVKHRNVPQKVQALRARAAALRGMRSVPLI